MVTTCILVSSLVGLLLILWFKTESIIEYSRIFGFDWLTHHKDYDSKKKNDAFLSYHAYLRQHHNCFFVRLITCPICFSIWVCLILMILGGKIIIFPIGFFGGLILFGIIDKLIQ